MASMSDDESFVVLGSTPTPSMNGFIDRMDNAVVANSNGASDTATANAAAVKSAGTDSLADSSVRFQLGPMNGSSLQLQPSANHQLRQNHINSVLSDTFSMLSVGARATDRRTVSIDATDGKGSNNSHGPTESGSFKSVAGSVIGQNNGGMQPSLHDNAEQMQVN